MEKGTNTRLVSLREDGASSWRLVALVSLVGCIFCEVLFNLLPIDHDTLLLYWFFPAALLLVSQLFFRQSIAKNMEIKLLFVTLVWSLATVVLNFYRAQIVDSYNWFAAACTALFLCFSLPYAFEKEQLARLLKLLAVATLIAVTLLSLVGLIAVFAEQVATKFPSIFEGVGIWGGRLGLDNHPNRSAPAPALGVIFSILVLTAEKRIWRRALAVLCGVICFVTLALTVSRTAIIATGLAVGFMAFILLRDALRPRMRSLFRWSLSALAAVAVVLVIYQGALSVAMLSNAAIEQQNAADVEAQAIVETQEEDPSDEEIVERDLSDADSFNGRTDIWRGVLNGLIQNPKILAFGTGPAMASEVMAPYFPEGSPVGIFHNSLVGALVAFGIVGLLLILLFLVVIAIASLRLCFGHKDDYPLLLRLLPAVLLFALADSMMEDFLFSNLSLNIVCVWFMLAAGFVLRLTGREKKTTPKEIA
jgi:O-antigen ligase